MHLFVLFLALRNYQGWWLKGKRKTHKGFFFAPDAFIRCPGPPVDSTLPPLSKEQRSKRETSPAGLIFLVPIYLSKTVLKSNQSVFWSVCTHTYFINFKISLHIKFHYRHIPYTKPAFSPVHNSNLVGQFSTNSIEWIGRCKNVFLPPLLKTTDTFYCYIVSSSMLLEI